MPSHITHLLFAEAAAVAAGIPELTEPPYRSYLAFGAQGPDIFYHNQRTKPTALAYGATMHRRGYGSVVSRMMARARERDHRLDSPAGAWILGFVTHAVLDRHAHPYINYFSGWPDSNFPGSGSYRMMHPFLERLIDVAMAERIRNLHPNDIRFFTAADLGPEVPHEWSELMLTGLRGTYESAAGDEALAEKLANAYRDSRGFYEFTEVIDESYLRRAIAGEDSGEWDERWISIVHPPNLPQEIDILNLAKREWRHPCDDGGEEATRISFPEIFDAALAEARGVLEILKSSWEAFWSEKVRRAVASAVGDHNLSDGRPTEKPCSKRLMDPLPLPELQARIRASIRDGRGGRV